MEKNFTYIVLCEDETLYTGWTNRLEARIEAHNQGKGAKYTKARRPVRLVYSECFLTKTEALKRERTIKKLTRKQKWELIQSAQREKDSCWSGEERKQKMRKVVSTKAAPAAIGPYAQANIFGNLVFTSGQVPLDPETGLIVGTTVEEQTEQVMKNISAILEAAGSSLDQVLKTTVFIQNMNDFAAVNGIYAKYFSEVAYPSRSAVEVARLPKDVLVEIETIAYLTDEFA